MKKSFTLIETLSSIILLSIVISGFLNLFLQNVEFKNHMNIQEQKNNISSGIFSSFSKNTISINYEIQKNPTLTFSNGTEYSKYTYSNQYKLLYYDIPIKESLLQNKVFK